MMKELVFAQALLLAGDVDGQRCSLLKVLCGAAASMLQSRLRDNVTAESCREEFIMAASLYALADLYSVEENGQIDEFKAGDLTIRQGGTVSSGNPSQLQLQAERLMKPYLQDSFSFMGV